MAGYLCSGFVTFNLHGIGIWQVYLILGVVHLVTLIISVWKVQEYPFLHASQSSQLQSQLSQETTTEITSSTSHVVGQLQSQAAQNQEHQDQVRRSAQDGQDRSIYVEIEESKAIDTESEEKTQSTFPKAGEVFMADRRSPLAHASLSSANTSAQSSVMNSPNSVQNLLIDPQTTNSSNQANLANISTDADLNRGIALDPFRADLMARMSKEERRRKFWDYFLFSGISSLSIKKRIGSFIEPFRSNNFTTVFVSRFFVQMGLITVQEYIQYYLKDAFTDYSAFGFQVSWDGIWTR